MRNINTAPVTLIGSLYHNNLIVTTKKKNKFKFRKTVVENI